MTKSASDLSPELAALPGSDRQSLGEFIRISESQRPSSADIEDELLASIAMKWRGAARAAS